MAQIHDGYIAKTDLRDGVGIVTLRDTVREMEVEIVPTLGNRVIGLRVRGGNFIWVPSDDPPVLKENPHTNGIPFLAPWANRMPDGFWANGTYYRFNLSSLQIHKDQNGIPIHGLLTASPLWQVVECAADEDSAYVTSRLDFQKYPHLMENWPLAHQYEMTHRLAGGVLEVTVTVLNLSAEPMPIAIGFHPYFQLPDVPISEAYAHVPVRRHVETDSQLVATGEMKPVDFPNRVSLRDHRFDDGFTGLQGEPFVVEGKGKRIEVTFGPKYQVAVVYAPPGQDYICFEPMTAITNGINLAHEHKYDALQTVAAGAQWRESFWVRPSLF